MEGHRLDVHAATGEIVREVTDRDLPAGQLLIRCNNRRATRRAACVETYRKDTFHRHAAKPEGPHRIGKGPLTCWLSGVAGFEPTTSSSRTKRAAKLRYTPVSLLFAATTFTLAHRGLETKSDSAAVADRGRADVVQGHQEDGQGVDREAQEEGVGQGAAVAVGRHVQERVEVAGGAVRGEGRRP